MKIKIETEFNIGDKVWKKNLVTNEASQTEIKEISTYFFINRKREQDSLIVYHTTDGYTLTKRSGKTDANSPFATKEEADACPAFDPKTIYN